MILRTLEKVIKTYKNEYPVIAIVGPRQSGKTTLARQIFMDYKYITLESLDNRKYATDDPRGFLGDCGKRVILDEVQRVPSLFSYLQEYVDKDTQPAQYVLTGSHQFLLMEQVSQTLAGRIITFKLFPFTFNEVYQQNHDTDVQDIFRIKQLDPPVLSMPEILFKGMYPRIHDRQLTPRTWIANYLDTYIERDIRLLVNISDLRAFENFLTAIASQSGQLINYANISNKIGISQPTVKKWLSLLEASGIVFILKPHHQNFLKRIVKTPKLYFVDTAVLCYLLNIKNVNELQTHPLYGNIFESFIISEFFKRAYHLGEKPPIYFWRDKTGTEIDLLVENGNNLLPIEIKTARTYTSSFYDPMKKWLNLKGNENKKGLVLYTGKKLFGSGQDLSIVPWFML